VSTTGVPPGNCVTHGYHGMVACPRCSSSVGTFTPLFTPRSVADRLAAAEREIATLRDVIRRYVVAVSRAPGNRDEDEIAAASEALVAVLAGSGTGQDVSSNHSLAKTREAIGEVGEVDANGATSGGSAPGVHTPAGLPGTAAGSDGRAGDTPKGE
jgi:hypothetical protein